LIRSLPDFKPPVQHRRHNWVERHSPAYLRISLALFLAGFCTFSLIYCVQPILPDLARDHALSPATASLALSLTTGLLALSIPLASAASDRLGRRGLIFVSMAAAALLNAACAAVPGWRSLLLARALEGVVLGGVPAVAMAYLAEEIHPQALGLAMGLYVGGTAFGGMVGRIGMGLLTEYGSWQRAMAITGGVGLLAAIGFVLLLPPSRNFSRRARLHGRRHLRAWRAHLRQPRLRALCLIGALVMGAFITLFNYLGFRLQQAPYGLGPSGISLMFLAYLFGMVAAPAGGALADRIGRAPVLVGGLLVTLAGVLLTLATPLGWIMAGLIALSIGFFVSHAIASAWVGHLARQARGHATSLYLLAYYSGASLLGWVGGWFWSQGGWSALAGFAVVPLAAALAIAVRLRAAA
jgi:YNFM family putative membrane transporter